MRQRLQRQHGDGNSDNVATATATMWRQLQRQRGDGNSNGRQRGDGKSDRRQRGDCNSDDNVAMTRHHLTITFLGYVTCS
jgi:hypothetical protein